METKEMNPLPMNDPKCLLFMTCGQFGVALRDTGKSSFQRYVTHRFNTDLSRKGDGYYWGHYFKTLNEAFADFIERSTDVVRNAGSEELADLLEYKCASSVDGELY